MNKYSQNPVVSAARLVLLVGGGGAAWMLPSTAAPESRVETAAPGAALFATAHVNFKIIVPQVLYVQVGNSNDRALGAQMVAVMSNSHNVGRTLIAQDAKCSLGARAAPPARNVSRAGLTAAHPVICTVSMP